MLLGCYSEESVFWGVKRATLRSRDSTRPAKAKGNSFQSYANLPIMNKGALIRYGAGPPGEITGANPLLSRTLESHEAKLAELMNGVMSVNQRKGKILTN